MGEAIEVVAGGEGVGAGAVRQLTKKDLALSLYAAGRTVEQIAAALETHPTYVANVLAAAGRTTDYTDLYVQQSDYARAFQGNVPGVFAMTAHDAISPIVALREQRRAEMPECVLRPLNACEVEAAREGVKQLASRFHTTHAFDFRPTVDGSLVASWCPSCGRWLGVDVRTGKPCGTAYDETCRGMMI